MSTLDDENERWIEQENKKIRKYTIEFEDNVCESHLPAIRDAVEIVLFPICTAEYGIRLLIDTMISDRNATDDIKLFTIGSIRTKLAEVRARIDDVLDRAEKEIKEKNNDL